MKENILPRDNNNRWNIVGGWDSLMQKIDKYENNLVEVIMETTDGQKREMKYCDCKKPKKNGGDNYCQICDGLIANLLELPVIQKIASIKEQALKGLLTDDGHHKQWFLEAILGMLTTEKEWLYLKEKEQWEEGIAP